MYTIFQFGCKDSKKNLYTQARACFSIKKMIDLVKMIFSKLKTLNFKLFFVPLCPE